MLQIRKEFHPLKMNNLVNGNRVNSNFIKNDRLVYTKF